MFSPWCSYWGSMASLCRKGTSCNMVKCAKLKKDILYAKLPCVYMIHALYAWVLCTEEARCDLEMVSRCGQKLQDWGHMRDHEVALEVRKPRWKCVRLIGLFMSWHITHVWACMSKHVVRALVCVCVRARNLHLFGLDGGNALSFWGALGWEVRGEDWLFVWAFIYPSFVIVVSDL
jgi:hypothetical protein